MGLYTRREFLRVIGLAPAAYWLRSGLSWASGPAEAAIRLNGRAVKTPQAFTGNLLDWLRHDLGLFGTKFGCGRGVCGACTVLIEGRPVRSCQVAPGHAAGLEVLTIEGLGGPDGLDDIQQTFADLCVFQCGYCAPGFLLTAKALLNNDPHPSEAQIRHALSGNLCRCTGYQRVVQAVRAVNDADYRRYLIKQPQSGLPARDRLTIPKLTGSLIYGQDARMDGQLEAVVVWSDQAHAEVVAIDVAGALEFPGVAGVLTYRDIPGAAFFGSVFQDQPVLARDKVRFRGDALAVVLADSLEAARRATGLVKVEYRPLPAVFDPKASLADDAPQLTPKGNTAHQAVCRKGDPELAREKATVIVKGRYRTPRVDPGYLEPEACLTYVDEEGRLVVMGPSQAPMSYRDQIADICALPRDRVRLETLPAGGAFGARGDMSIQHLCALGTLTSGRPVRLALTREESAQVHATRHPFFLEYETGADAQGRLTHCIVKGLADAGAYHSATLPVVENAAAFATGPYQIDDLAVEITAAFTNNPVSGAMRGFGVLQVCLGMERQMDRLAARLGLDPGEFRRINVLEEGRVSQWGQVMGPETGARACLEAAMSAAREMSAGAVRPGPFEKIGVGLACGYKNTSTPTYLPLGRTDVFMELAHDGLVEIEVGGCEIGQGLVAALTRIASEALGLPPGLIRIHHGGTDHITSVMLTSASQQVFLTGGAVWEAGPLFRQKLISEASSILGRAEDELALGAAGVTLGPGGPSLAGYEELAWRAGLSGLDISLHHEYALPVQNIELPKVVEKIGPDQRILPSLGYAAQAALVAVNVKTGAVRVIKVTAAQDVGRAIDPAGVRGQVEGGVVMGLGWCLSEEVETDSGRVVNSNFDRYFMPVADKAPELETIIIENPDPYGPMGAKGLGEVPLLPTAPAILGAIQNAVGLEIEDIPVRPADLLRLLNEAKT